MVEKIVGLQYHRIVISNNNSNQKTNKQIPEVNMKGPGWIFKELCAVVKSQSQKITYDIITFI